MAITNEFFNALNDPKAALWSAGVAFNRSNPLPLDKWSVFQSKEAAISYAETNAVAYPGQIIAVYDEGAMHAYVLAEIGEEENSKLSLQPIGIIPTGDGAISVSEDGVISVGVDGVTIEVVNNALTLMGYSEAEEGAQLVKTESGLGWIKPDNTIITELAETVEGLAEEVDELKTLIGSEAQYDEAGEKVSEASGLVAAIQELESTKANAADVYTKTETDKAIGDAVAAVNHLKRIKVDDIDDIKLNADDADQYIYMVPTGLQEDDDKYDEYMVFEGVLERVGSWEINLSAYATKEELTAEVNRAKQAEQEAKSAADAAQADVDALEEDLVELAEIVDGKVDAVYYQVKDEETGEFISVPGTLLTPEDREKLGALVIDKDGNVGISGSVNAENVEGLGSWLTDNASTYIQNIGVGNLSQDLLDKVNYITSVTDNFKVVNGELQLVKVAQSSVDGLTEVLADKASVENLNELASEVGNLDKILNGYVNDDNEEIVGLIENVSKLSTKVSDLEQFNTSLDNTYVTQNVFNSTVQNLNDLISTNTTNISSLSAKYTELSEHLTWQNL
jgi:hypothetical protein